MAFAKHFITSENAASLAVVIYEKAFQLVYAFKFEDFLRCCPVLVASHVNFLDRKKLIGQFAVPDL